MGLYESVSGSGSNENLPRRLPNTRNGSLRPLLHVVLLQLVLYLQIGLLRDELLADCVHRLLVLLLHTLLLVYERRQTDRSRMSDAPEKG